MQCALEEWLAHPGWLLGEDEVGMIEHHGGDVPDRARFHHVDEFGIHRFVVELRGNQITSARTIALASSKIVDVGGDTQAVLVCLVDYRGIDFWLELGG